MFTPSELKLIQDGKWLPELSHFVVVTSPRNLDDNLNHARDEGEKIDLLIHTALNPHAPALIGLGEFLNSRDLTILAATLRGFASIGETLKQQNLDPNYRHHLEQLKYVLTANLDLHDDENPSVHLFKRLCHDAESGGSEMVRWAAAHALQELDYPLNLRRQLLSRPPAEILAEIWTKYEMRLSESNRQRDPSKMLEVEDVKFGIYGDTKRLFAKCDEGYSLEIAREVLRKSGVRGIKLAIESRNKPIVKAAINFAGELFNNNLYKDNATRQKLADLLLPFLNQADFDLRNLAAEKLNDKRNQYDVSNRFIDQNNRAKVAVIDTDWNRAISLGDLAIPALRQAVEATLRIEKAENLNINCQIAAAETIDKILTVVSRKISTLSPYLQHNNHNVRTAIVGLLKPHQSSLDIKSSQIMTALLFQLNLSHESNISLSNSQLNKSIVESYIRLAESHKQSIQDIFNKSISACENKSTGTKDFMSQQRKALIDRTTKYTDNLNRWLKDYAADLESKARAKAEELKKQNQELERQTLCRKLLQDKNSTKEQIQKLQVNIETAEKKQSQYSKLITSELSQKANRKQSEIFYELLQVVVLGPVWLFGVFLFIWLIATFVVPLTTKTTTPNTDARNIATNVCIVLYGFWIIYGIGEMITTASAKTEKERLESHINNISNQINTLKSQKSELEKQLYAIENKMRDNKCS